MLVVQSFSKVEIVLTSSLGRKGHQLEFFIHLTCEPFLLSARIFLCRRNTITVNTVNKDNSKELQINDEIRDREVRVIDENGQQLGVMSAQEANRLADERNLDLVKISPQANPPVCKFLDYGKYRFELIKKKKEAKKSQKVIEVKEIWLSATIDTHDLEVKAKQAIKFVAGGDKVRLSIRLKGRQMAHPEIAMAVMDEFFKLVEESAMLEKPAKQEGRTIAMVIAPAKK